MVDCTITIALDSNPSDAISTSPRSFLLIFYLPLQLHTENNIVLHSLALRQTSYRFDLTHTAFYCVPDIIPRTLTSTHCVPPCSTAFFQLSFVLAHVGGVPGSV